MNVRSDYLTFFFLEENLLNKNTELKKKKKFSLIGPKK